VKVSIFPFIFVLYIINISSPKARSSAKRKERLLYIQTLAEWKPALTLLLDMKVRWSSTYNMLARGLKLKEVHIIYFMHTHRWLTGIVH
jgi:hypothetical protein